MVKRIRGEIEVWRLVPQWHGHDFEGSPDMKHMTEYFTPVPRDDNTGGYHVLLSPDTENPAYTENDLVVLKNYELNGISHDSYGMMHYLDQVWAVEGSYWLSDDKVMLKVRLDKGLSEYQRSLNEQAKQG